MTNPWSGRIGAVLSADIAVPDHAREKHFYSRVLTTGTAPLWREADLTNNLGLPIIGLGARSDEYASLPLQWMPHIQVEDVGRSVEKALARGGTEIMHAKDDRGRSQWAVLSDPDGAAFGIIPVVASEAAALPRSDSSSEATAPFGRIAWLDLTVPDAAESRDFYSEVIGWSSADVEMKAEDEGYFDFNMLDREGKVTAGICHARGGNAGLPAVWMIYLPVGDLTESLRRVEEEGGEILKAVRGKREEYVYAAIRDPVGVALALVPAG